MYRKALKYLVPLLLLIVFWQSAFEMSVGLLAKGYLRLAKGWILEYRSVVLKESGEIVFSKVGVRSPSQFEVEAEEISVFFQRKHLAVEKPKIKLQDLPTGDASGSNWTFAIREGEVEGVGIEPFRFQGERYFPQEVGRFSLAWQGGRSLSFEIFRGEAGRIVNAAFSQFDPLLLERWFGKEVRGEFSGVMHLIEGVEGWERGTFEVEAKGAAFREIASNVSGTFHFEGLFRHPEEGRFRLDLEEGTVHSEEAEIRGLKGEFSYAGNVGAKWEIVGEEEKGPLVFQGRGFFPEEEKHWLEVELLFQESRLALSGEKNGDWEWDFSCKELNMVQASLLQSFYHLVDPKRFSFILEEGTLDFAGRATSKNWEISSFALRDFSGKEGDRALFVKEAKGRYASENLNGEFFFDGARVQWDAISAQISEWKGSGAIVEGLLTQSKFQGKVDDFALLLDLEGNLSHWKGHLDAEGPRKGEFFLSGAWDGKRLGVGVDEGKLDLLAFKGSGWVDSSAQFFFHSEEFSAPLSMFSKKLEGELESSGAGFTLNNAAGALDWTLDAACKNGACPLFSQGEVRNVTLELKAAPDFFACTEIRGDLVIGPSFPFYCPIVQKRGEFDIRLLGPTWDFLRLTGNVFEEEIELNLKTSHLLGAPFRCGRCFFQKEGPESLQLEMRLPWSSALSALASFFPKESWASLPISGEALLSFNFEKNSGSELAIQGETLSWKGEVCPLSLYAHQEEGRWNLEQLQVFDSTFSGDLSFDKKAVKISSGKGKKGGAFDFDFEGKIDLARKIEVHFSKMKVDLNLLTPYLKDLPLGDLKGTLAGTGHLVWNDKFETDFDLAPFALQKGDLHIQARAPFRIHYASDQGLFFQGLEVETDSKFYAKIGLIQFHPQKELWSFQKAQVHLPAGALELPFSFDPAFDIDCTFDSEASSDFSEIHFSMQEGHLPLFGALHHVEGLSLSLNEKRVRAAFSYEHQGHPLDVELKVALGEKKEGRLILKEKDALLEESERPMAIDWTHSLETGLSIEAIEGAFGGVDALFHKETEGVLIGSARVNCHRLKELLPPKVAEVFYDLKMGKGYEAKGRLTFLPDDIVFKGLLSGKQLELFGFQIRTLLGNIEISSNRVKISDLKLSDSAGILTVGDVLAEGKGDLPWTISIPKLVVTELRPSLLQKEGGIAPTESGPLVVREFNLVGFEGKLDDKKTFTAKGDCRFINSFRREYTLFDVPSDVLSRIVGIDLEILIPVRGNLTYELKEGFFHLLELTDSYSEGGRTEFFLVTDDEEPPTMDLDGNLQILVKMKQFVLFKFTESFLISIGGKLDDPKFHLQKKKRFLGL